MRNLGVTRDQKQLQKSRRPCFRVGGGLEMTENALLCWNGQARCRWLRTWDDTASQGLAQGETLQIELSLASQTPYTLVTVSIPAICGIKTTS